MNYREIRRATVWPYTFNRRIDGRVPPAEVTRPYEKLPIPTDLAKVHITLLVVNPEVESRTGALLQVRTFPVLPRPLISQANVSVLPECIAGGALTYRRA